MKRASLLAFLVPVFAAAQAPEVAVFADLRPTFSVEGQKTARFQWYDLQGRYSLVGFRIILETGHRVSVAQRLQRVENSGDPETLDEYYVEDRGIWRLGKQYLPFGNRSLVREAALGIRLDTRLLIEDLPLSIAVCDAGPGRSRGVVGRLGRNFGVSFAYGDHFVIQSSSLTPFQRPREAVGRGGGYRLALGADVSLPLGPGQLSAEWVSLRDGESPLDREQDLSDLQVRVGFPFPNTFVTFAWGRNWTSGQNSFRAWAELPFGDQIEWVPYVRMDGVRVQDVGLSARVRF